MTDWAKLRVNDLRAELKKRGLPTAGVKAELVGRLDEDDATDATPEEPQSDVVEQNLSDADAGEAPTVAATELASPTAIELDDTQPPLPQEKKEAETEAQNGKVTDTAPSLDLADVPEPVSNGSSTTEAFISEPAQADSPELARDVQKRKRRSASPPPSIHDTKRPKVGLVPDDDTVMGGTEHATAESISRPSESKAAKKAVEQPGLVANNGHTDEIIQETVEPLLEDSRQVSTSIHAPTCSLYIKNLMRPLHLEDIRAHLIQMAVAPGSDSDEQVLTECFLDQVRTHAFATFCSRDAAQRVRSSLHDAVFPKESNRKALWVDFIPDRLVQEWIDREEREPRSSSVRFEVVYDQTEDGTNARLAEIGGGSDRGRGAAPPTGPRIHPGVEGAPLAPRADQQRGRGFRAPRLSDPAIRTTRCNPMIYWKPISEDLAQRRIENMRRFYKPDARITNDDKRNHINRYFFENGDSFVDRGKEIFAGIRPPHREREHRRLMREQRQQGGNNRLLDPTRRDRNRIPAPQSFRPSGGDRYLGSAARGDTWRESDTHSRRGRGGGRRDNRNRSNRH